MLNCVTMALDDPLCVASKCIVWCTKWEVSSGYWADHSCHNSLEMGLHFVELLLLTLFSFEMLIRISALEVYYFAN